MKTEDIIQKQDELINHLRRFIHTEIVEEGIILPDKHEWNDFINIDKSLRAELSSLKSMRDEKEEKPDFNFFRQNILRHLSTEDMIALRNWLNGYESVQTSPQPQPGRGAKTISITEALDFIKDKNIPSKVDRGYIARWMTDFVRICTRKKMKSR